MSIPGMEIKLGQSSAYELDGGKFDDIPLKEVMINRREGGSTPGDIGTGKEAEQYNVPTPLTSTIESITVKFVSMDKGFELVKWHNVCTNPIEREWDKHDLMIKGLDAKREVVEQWEVTDCYPDIMEQPSYSSGSTDLGVYTLKLKGSTIKRTK